MEDGVHGPIVALQHQEGLCPCTRQIVPSILAALGLKPRELEAVIIEGTAPPCVDDVGGSRPRWNSPRGGAQ
ncbi:hypothetical protein BC938DRAFT_478894 [Jimgerdemannia flammicorona]|uniref:Uncharacterized protein n=1 Tax=Jimgerdemannia flammicorona TaxID=994334 RepID=A0A433QM44_9FUNG|nr:hypothetical protein BC938DRAFT_478894 [Jimgerdemannia flammicorona]